MRVTKSDIHSLSQGDGSERARELGLAGESGATAPRREPSGRSPGSANSRSKSRTIRRDPAAFIRTSTRIVIDMGNEKLCVPGGRRRPPPSGAPCPLLPQRERPLPPRQQAPGRVAARGRRSGPQVGPSLPGRLLSVDWRTSLWSALKPGQKPGV